jgi:hypothetical protein
MHDGHETIDGIRTGHPKAGPETPAHVPGIRSGNDPRPHETAPGHLPDGRSTARRSTGINARDREPIQPDMPNLSPA